uniref:ATP synthase F0 subunit 8 n=1 Tax=Phrynus sp. AH-2005 TaxID=309714 RepID=Q535G2_9ARAC|nr:ATP synthase F0 subunit 8 [Phrynus sp. AH-2005]
MPQMAPMSWIIMTLIPLLITSIMSNKIHFSTSTPTPTPTISYPPNKQSWKW